MTSRGDSSRSSAHNAPSAIDSETDRMDLTPSAKFELDYIVPPADLSDFVTTFYHFRCDEVEIRDIQPAAVGHLALFPKGRGEMQFEEGRAEPNHKLSLLTPFSYAVPFVVTGPLHSIGAAMTPIGWAALTGLHAGDHGNHIYPAGDWLGPDAAALGDRLARGYCEGALDGQACVDTLSGLIRSNLKKVSPRHRDLIRQVNKWVSEALNPDVPELLEKIPYSERQVQRLTERYFGLPPRALARKYRALRTAALLSLPMLSDETEAQIGEAFYDQPHMIREIREFVGRTPARLSDSESPYLTEMLDPKNFREISGDQP